MDNTNKEKVIDLVEIAKKILAKRKMIIVWVALGATIGIVIAISKLGQYTAMAIIVPEEANNKSSSMGAIVGWGKGCKLGKMG